MTARHAKALRALGRQQRLQMEGARPADPLLACLHQQAEPEHGEQQLAQPRPSQQREQQRYQGKLKAA